MRGSFILANLSVGYTFSTVATNQLQAMQMSFFFFLPNILLSGFMFPFRGMPGWAQAVGEALPLTTETARAAVADHLADGGTALDSWSAETDGTEVTVRCGRSVQIAFGWLFLGGRPLEVAAVAGARAPAL